MSLPIRKVVTSAVLTAFCIAVACVQQPEPTATQPTSQPTATPEPTATATATATTTPTRMPTATIDPTATIAPSPTMVSTPTPFVPMPAPTPAPTRSAVPTSTPQPTALPTATATPVPTTTAIPEPRPIEGKRGGKLRFAIPSAPPHQDIHESVSPILAAWGPGIAYSRIFRHQWNNTAPRVGLDSLNDRFDPVAASFAGDVLCDICADWHMDDTDNLTVVLRQDVKWQDLDPLRGRKIAASDIVFSLDRIQDPSFHNRDLLNTVSAVTAIDEATLVIETSIPDAELFEKLADARAAIVTPEAVAVNGNLRSGPTVGTGPWILGRYEPLLITFSANLDYFIPVLPLTFSLEASVVPELSTRIVMIQVDASDFVQADLEALRNAASSNPDVMWTTEFDAASGIEIAMNTTRQPLTDVKVRRAIIKSWNPDALVTGLHDGMSFISAGIPLRDPAWLLPDAEVQSYFDDATNAIDLLRAAGNPSGQLTIKVGAYGDAYTQTALSLANAVRTAGFIPTIQSISTREFADDVWIRGNYDIYVGAPPPQSSATSMLFSVHHSQGPWNSNGFKSPDLDDLIVKQTTQTDAVARREDLLQIQRLILGGAYRFVAAANVSIWTWSPSVQNFAPNSFRGDSHWLARIWLLE